MKIVGIMALAISIAACTTSSGQAGSGQQAFGESSVAVAGSVREVAARSDIVILGTAIADSGAIANVGGDGKSPTFSGQYELFVVSVELALKGSPGAEVKVVLLRAYGPPGQPQAANEAYLPLRIGQRYALFLRALGSGIYSVAQQPNRWAITGADARVETHWSDVERRFPARPLTQLSDETRAAASR